MFRNIHFIITILAFFIFLIVSGALLATENTLLFLPVIGTSGICVWQGMKAKWEDFDKEA